MSSSSRIVSTSYRHATVALGELLRITRDGEQGLRMCAIRAESGSLRTLFTAMADRYRSAAAELHELIGRIGGDPSMRCVIPGAARRGWVGLHESLALTDDRALIDDCERAEDHALEVYRNALDDHLPEFVRQAVLQQFEGLMQDHHRIRLLGREPHPTGAVVVSYGGHTQP
ncbi:MAG TPA: PA2169 family four-helix-bundle protein [Steroidobacteraceae bacterium]|nr:PA2169 family four-helix-bundle protein [Steroidobacteraceae bacterium]